MFAISKCFSGRLILAILVIVRLIPFKGTVLKELYIV